MSQASSFRETGTPSKRHLISFRISAEHWLADDALNRLLEFFKAFPHVLDELVLFTSYIHPPLPLEEINRRADRLNEVSPLLRELGVRVGVNVLATMGHHEENLDASLDETWQRVTDPHGSECAGSFCPSDPRHREYVRALYTRLARADIDFIWLDDDLRLAGHAPVSYTCFCGTCIAELAKSTGLAFTRDSLVAALNRPFEESSGLRRLWLAHNRRLLDSVYREVEQVVHAVRPGLELGGMTGDLFWEGHGYDLWAESLAGRERAPVRWRPGGGFYTDACPAEMLAKAHQIGQQVADLPFGVRTIQAEIESFPYQRLEKSTQATVVEAAAYMAAGATGCSFNVLSQHSDALAEYAPLVEHIARCRPFYETLQTETKRFPARGVWSAWNQDLAVATDGAEPWIPGKGSLGAVADVYRPHVLSEIGIPVSYSQAGAAVTALAGCTPRAFNPEALETIFRGGVVMDVAAWRTMDAMGLSSWTAVRPGESFSTDTMEVLTGHPLNGAFAGFRRDCRQSFPGWQENAFRLEATHQGVETLSRLVGYRGEDRGPAMTAYENPLGGRVVIMGYYPWTRLHSLAKSSQMKAVCEWLSRGCLPAIVETFSRVAVWVRQGPEGHLAVVLLNASLDPVEGLALRVRTQAASARHVRMDASQEEICGIACDISAGYRRFVLPNLPPWTAHLLVLTG